MRVNVLDLVRARLNSKRESFWNDQRDEGRWGRVGRWLELREGA